MSLSPWEKSGEKGSSLRGNWDGGEGQPYQRIICLYNQTLCSYLPVIPKNKFFQQKSERFKNDINDEVQSPHKDANNEAKTVYSEAIDEASSSHYLKRFFFCVRTQRRVWSARACSLSSHGPLPDKKLEIKNSGRYPDVR